MARGSRKVRGHLVLLSLILFGWAQSGLAQSNRPDWLENVVADTRQAMTVAASKAGVEAPVLVIRQVKDGWEVGTEKPVNYSLVRTIDALFRKLALYARSDGYQIDLNDQVIRISRVARAIK